MSIVETCTEEARKAGGSLVSSVELEIGKLSGVIPEALEFSWDVAIKDSLLENASLKINEISAKARCLDCGKRYTFGEIKARLESGEEIPDCEVCHGILKPDIVMFGEQLPVDVLQEAGQRARECDLCIVVGSTLIVYPAAFMPIYAVESGARLVIINIGDTPMDNQASVVIDAKAGETMERVVGKVKEKLNN